MEKNEKAVEVRNLKYVYTQPELVELGKEYAYANRQLAELEDQKKSLNAQMTSQISAQKEMVNLLTTKVGNGYQYRDVECDVFYHSPEKGFKTIERTDIDETRTDMEAVTVEKMTEKDWMLWNDKFQKLECDVEMHVPTVDQKTYTQRSTGFKFIENMSTIEIEDWEEECDVELQFPKDGWKTLTHRTTFVKIEKKMTQSDLEKTQMSLFGDEKQEANELEEEVVIDDEVENLQGFGSSPIGECPVVEVPVEEEY